MSRLREPAWIAALGLAGLLAAALKLPLALENPWIGHADEAAYAEMADSLLQGRGFEVDYVSFFFRRYDAVSRPEDHWPPLHAVLIAPCFLAFGKVAWAAKLPSIAIASLLLPLATGLLARRLSGSRAVGLAAGLHVLIHPDFFALSLRALADVTFAFTVCLATWLAVRTLDDGRGFPALGAALALACYAKGSGLLLIPAAATFHLLTRPAHDAARDRRFLLGMAIAALALLPWLVRNAVHFGNPFYSTQQHVAGFFGYEPFEPALYRLYWDEPPPSLGTKLERWGLASVASRSLAAFAQNLWWVFVDFHAPTGQLTGWWLYTGPIGIPAAVGLALFLGWTLFRRAGPPARDGAPAGWQQPALHALWLVPLWLLGFLSLTWLPMNRLALPVVPLVVATGWMMVREVGVAPFRSPRARSAAGTAALLAWLLAVGVPSVAVIREDMAHPRYPYAEDPRAWIDTARWIGAELPGSVTLTRNPWELHFYSGQPAVQIPSDGLAAVLRVARHYGATHLIPAPERPALAPWLDGRIPGLVRVRDGPVPVYEIRYDELQVY